MDQQILEQGLSSDPVKEYSIVPVGDNTRRPSRTSITAPKKKVTFCSRVCNSVKEGCKFLFDLITGILNLALYFLDVYTDVNLAVTFYAFGHRGWFSMMAGFIAIPYVVALFGIRTYVQNEPAVSVHGVKKALFYIFLPVFPIFFDLLMPFFRQMSYCLPDTMMQFMVTYEATRTLSETVLETIPQLGLQVYIWFYCQTESDCEGIESEAGEALTQSLLISTCGVLFHFIMTYVEMRREGLTFKAYLKSLIRMGAGLPLAAITGNTIDKFTVHGQLKDSQVHSLSVALKETTSLAYLDLSSSDFSDKTLLELGSSLEQNQSLTFLKLSGSKISPAGVKTIAASLGSNTNLQQLILNNVEIDIDELKGKTDLATLDYSGKGFNDTSMVIVAACLKENVVLTELNMSLNDAGGEGLVAMAATLEINSSITSLDLSNKGKRHSVAGLAALGSALSQNTTLKRLKLTFFPLKLEDLKGHTNKTTIDLSGYPYGDDDVPILWACLKQNKSVERMKLFDNQMGEYGAQMFGEVLEINQTHVSVDLCNTKSALGTIGIDYIRAGIAKHKSLKQLKLANFNIPVHELNGNTGVKSLSFENSHVTNEDAIIIGELIKGNKTLKDLNLDSNVVGDVGAIGLAAGLALNTTLTNLSLRFNKKIGDQGMQELGAALKVHPALKKLDLWDNNIGPLGASGLAQGLRQNKVLTQLNLYKNKLGDKGATYLLNAFKARGNDQTLRSLDLRQNALGASVKRELKDLAKQCGVKIIT